MSKQLFIFLTLFSTYALILGHNTIPHHHDKVADMAHHEHHDHHSHSHSHDHDAKSDTDEHEGGLPEFFSYFLHSSHTASETYTLQVHNEIVVKKEISTILISFCYPAFIKEIPNSHHPPEFHNSYYSGFYFRSLPLRAPPTSIA